MKKIYLTGFAPAVAVLLIAGAAGQVQAVTISSLRNPHTHIVAPPPVHTLTAPSINTVVQNPISPTDLLPPGANTPATLSGSADFSEARLPHHNRVIAQPPNPIKVIPAASDLSTRAANVANVPDGGMTAMMLGSVISGVFFLRHTREVKRRSGA